MELFGAARAVLQLLVGPPTLTSADAWRAALSCCHEKKPPTGINEQEPTAPTPPHCIAIDALEVVVPHLSDYKTFSLNLCGLLDFYERECINELFNVVERWLGLSSSEPGFRAWLYSYLDGITDRMLALDEQRWKQMLLFAALKEDNARLRQVLLKLIDRRIGCMGGVVATPPTPRNDLLRLVLFCWNNSDKLRLSWALCAAKFVELSRGSFVESEEIVAVLRWGLALKPLFFANFVETLRAMRVFSRSVEPDLHLPPEVEKLVGETSELRSAVESRLRATQQQISSALQRDVKHLCRRQVLSATVEVGLHGSPSTEWPGRDLAVSFLCADLAIVPTDIFPSVLAALLAVSMDTLHGKKGGCPVSAPSIQSIFSLLQSRSDLPSLSFVLAAVMELNITKSFVWDEDLDFFKQIVEELSESAILEPEAMKKRVVHMALNQLLLECNTQLLHSKDSFLRDHVPEKIYQRVAHRTRLNP